MKYLFLTLLLSATTISAQTTFKAEEFTSYLLPTKTGAKNVFNGSKHSFTVDYVGEVKAAEKPNFAFIGNVVVQALTIQLNKQLDLERKSEKEIEMYLLDYMNYEVEYTKEVLKTSEINEKYEFLKLNGRLFLYWTFDMPKSKENVKQNCYLVTFCYNNVFVLSSPVDKNQKEKKIRKHLEAIALTLKLNEKPLNIEKLKEKIKS
ncbi:MAG: hypothetical protein RL264_563 [Bacteroidota bacterium]|jgi:hypothetical protein